MLDIIIIGAGHNGLTCAGYLARAGLKVLVLEKNAVVGGAAITEEFHPGFRNSVASYTVSLLNPKVIRDLELARYGLQVLERPAANYLPVERGAGLLMPYGMAARQAELAKFSQKDAARYPEYDAALERAAGVLRDVILKTPPNAGGGLLELIKGGGVARKALGRSLQDQRSLISLPRARLIFLMAGLRTITSKRCLRLMGLLDRSHPRRRRGPPTCCCIIVSAK
jgi:phytoene dehydrogenase-like protein